MDGVNDNYVIFPKSFVNPDSEQYDNETIDKVLHYLEKTSHNYSLENGVITTTLKDLEKIYL